MWQQMLDWKRCSLHFWLTFYTSSRNKILQGNKRFPQRQKGGEEVWEYKHVVFWHWSLICTVAKLKMKLTWPRVKQVNRPNLLCLRWPSGPVSWRRSLQDTHTHHTHIVSPFFLFLLLKRWHALAASDGRHQVRENRYTHICTNTGNIWWSGTTL